MLPKLVQDVAKVDTTRYNLELCSLANANNENSQSSDTDNTDDSSILDVDRGSHEDEACNHGVGSGYGSVGGHGCLVHQVLLYLAKFPFKRMD
ncbi:hypothetical protein Ddye_011678 [Dipteronia dyeriana]|uniref:Uncharacterized protein n=1 Tax=Dipteronia dyeriana TaxID=168575 RepID=A0AAE0CHG1_9ROSI|nr:hypothetical protein Ddye_011678 [Dipteronia dyeriana]